MDVVKSSSFIIILGYCVDLIAAVSELCGGFKYIIRPNKDSVYGAKTNGTWTGMIGELVQGVNIGQKPKQNLSLIFTKF